MRYRLTFIAGLAIGFVLGARAGRERYEQLRKLARRAAESPAVQHAADSVQAQAAEYAKAARDRLMDRADEARAKVGGALHERVPGLRSHDANGHSHVRGHARYDPSAANDPEEG